METYFIRWTLLCPSRFPVDSPRAEPVALKLPRAPRGFSPFTHGLSPWNSKRRLEGQSEGRRKMKRNLPFLAAAILALCEALLAVDRAVSAGSKRYFALFLAVCANRLEHFPWSSAESTTTLLKCHL